MLFLRSASKIAKLATQLANKRYFHNVHYLNGTTTQQQNIQCLEIKLTDKNTEPLHSETLHNLLTFRLIVSLSIYRSVDSPCLKTKNWKSYTKVIDDTYIRALIDRREIMNFCA